MFATVTVVWVFDQSNGYTAQDETSLNAQKKKKKKHHQTNKQN